MRNLKDLKDEEMPGYKTRFKPGVSGNPAGKPIVSPEVLRMQRMTRDELASCASWLVKGNKEDLKKIVEDPSSSILSIMVASLAMNAIKKGNFQTFNAILDRVVGKPKEMAEPKDDGGPIAIQQLTDGDIDRIRELADQSARNRASGGRAEPVNVDIESGQEG